MKKTYIQPGTEALTLTQEEMLAQSGVKSNSDYGITYGGVDTDGSKDPSVKEDVFDCNPFE